MALGLSYQSGPVTGLLLVDYTNKGKEVEGVKHGKDQKTVTLGGAYDFGVAKVYAAGQYFDDANTVGGDIEAGLAIAELIAGMRKPTVTLVLGGGHSIGIPLAVSGKVTMIAPSASMTIHPVRMSGTVIAVPATYQYFDRIQERIIAFVAKNSHISADRFRALMLATGDMANDVGSIVYGEEAVELGLMDQIGTLSDALNCLYEMIDHNNDNRDDEDKDDKKD
jgi:ATP-dependent protease ClpP protease subunit